MSGALSGVRVLDMSKTIAGPYTGSLLGDMGADVIKIEPPGMGDDFRYTAPIVNGESYYFMLANRNKQSLTLNLKDDRARRIFYELTKKADVVIESYRPGTVDRLGVDYKTLSALNPRLVYCSISGFGQDGPYRDRAAYDLICQAMGGIMSVTGRPGGEPTPVGVPVVDVLTALFSIYGILSALVCKEKTGKGQYVDTSLFEASIAPLLQMAGIYFATGKPPMTGQKQEYLVPYGVFKAKDGVFVLEAGNDATWRRLCYSAGLNDMAEDPRFQKNYERAKYKDALLGRLQEALQKKTVEEWVKILGEEGVPAGPIYSLDQVFSDPQTIYRKMVVDVDHPKAGKVKLIGIPVKMSATPGSIARPPPMLGQHTDEILKELGYSDNAIAALRKDGAI